MHDMGLDQLEEYRQTQNRLDREFKENSSSSNEEED